MSSCIYLLHVSLIAITLGPQPHGDEIAFANTLMTARSIPLAHPSHSAIWLVFYLQAGGLTIAPFGTPMPVTSRRRGSDHLVDSLAWLALFWPYDDAQRRRSL